MAASKRLLVMDDESLVLEIVVAFGTRMGFEVVGAADGGEAVGAYREALAGGDEFSLVILDLSVPVGMDGVHAAQQIQAMDPEARLILSSGNPNDAVCMSFREYGFSGLMEKPFTMAGFRRCVQEVLALPE